MKHPSRIHWYAFVLAAVLSVASLGQAWADPGAVGEIPPVSANAYFPLVFNNFDGYHSSVAVRKQPAFDGCYLPNLSKMQVWWNKSPYWSVNLYLGGISLSAYCNPSQITREWLAAADQQGWTFIPTWVGLQAPCTTYKYRLSENTTTARQQGRQEADAAVSKARSVGFDFGLVLYLDIEPYPGGQNTGCRAAVKSYVSGWVERLHELGVVAGAYGGSSNSYVYDWASIPNIPDNVWVASWLNNYGFSTSASVMDIPNLPNANWANHQRIRQYAFEINETWGGVTLNIDSDAADGALQVFQTANRFPPPPSPADSLTVEGPVVVDLQQVTSDQGWILTSQGLQWTVDSGKTWEARITPGKNTSRYLGAYFIDSQKGWLVAQAVDGKISLYHTDNNGQTWQEKVLAGEGLQEPPEIEKAYLAFSDDQSGWISLKLQTGSAFSQGELLRTRDAGLTWEMSTLPVGGPVIFTDEQHAWLVGGPGQSRIYESEDGGKAWNEVSKESANAAGVQAAGARQMGVPGAGEQQMQSLANLPEGTNAVRQVSSQSGWALVWTGNCSGEKTRADFRCEMRNQVFATKDGGQSWSEITPAQ